MSELKLNIQLFADDQTTIDTTQAQDAKSEIDNATTEFVEETKGAEADINNLLQDNSFQSLAGNAVKSVFDYISPKLGEFQTVAADLGSFLTFVISTYETSDEEMRKEFESWGESITGAVSKIKAGLNSTVSKGSYTSSAYIADMSQSTRNIVSEVSTMFQKTGDLYTSATGKTVIQTAKDFGKAAVGSMNTLFGWLGNGGNSIASLVFNK